MSDSYLAQKFFLPDDAELRGALIALLSALGFTGFVEDAASLEGCVPASAWSPDFAAALEAVLDRPEFAFVRQSEKTSIAARDWNEEWERSIKPIRVSDRITVSPSWHRAAAPAGGIVLTIDPKMSFGTGYHETTRIMLRLMERHTPPGGTILDVGTGTGILAIAAVRLGAAQALGVDTDEWSASNGNENIDRNGLRGIVEIREGSLEVVPPRFFEMVLANIQRSVILELLDQLLQRLKPAGVLLLSGLLTEDRSVVEQALNVKSARTFDDEAEGEWIGLAARKES